MSNQNEFQGPIPQITWNNIILTSKTLNEDKPDGVRKTIANSRIAQRSDTEYRIVDEIIQNWHDEIVRESVNDVDTPSRVKAGHPVLQKKKAGNMSYYRFSDIKIDKQGANKSTEFVYGEMWISSENYTITRNEKIIEIPGPFIMAVNYETRAKYTDFYSIGKSSKNSKELNMFDRPGKIAGMNGTGIKFAAANAMRYKVNFQYVINNTHMYFEEEIIEVGTDKEENVVRLIKEDGGGGKGNFKGLKVLVSEFGNKVKFDDERYLFLQDNSFFEKYKAYYHKFQNGEECYLFGDPRMTGKIYIKGFYVYTDPNLLSGFSTNCGSLDEARKKETNNNNLNISIWRMHVCFALHNQAALKEIYDTLKNFQKSDYVRDFKEWACDERLSDGFLKLFKEEYGENCVPCHQNQFEKYASVFKWNLNYTPVKICHIGLYTMLCKKLKFNLKTELLGMINIFENSPFSVLTPHPEFIKRLEDSIQKYSGKKINVFFKCVDDEDVERDALVYYSKDTFYFNSRLFKTNEHEVCKYEENEAKKMITQAAFDLCEIPATKSVSFIMDVLNPSPNQSNLKRQVNDLDESEDSSSSEGNVSKKTRFNEGIESLMKKATKEIQLMWEKNQ